MTRKTKEIIEKLDEYYGTEVECSLDYQSPLELLIATILSAQCTDARVNQVTPGLFEKYPTARELAEAELSELEQDIHSTGFYHHKAKNIIACCQRLIEEYDGEVPREMEDLTSLPGVGRKTANVVRSHVYNEPSVVVDTHVGRISRRLGMTKEEDPEKVERELMKKLPKDHWSLWNSQLIRLGREICTSRAPKCALCFLRENCPEGKKRLKGR